MRWFYTIIFLFFTAFILVGCSHAEKVDPGLETEVSDYESYPDEQGISSPEQDVPEKYSEEKPEDEEDSSDDLSEDI